MGWLLREARSWGVMKVEAAVMRVSVRVGRCSYIGQTRMWGIVSSVVYEQGQWPKVSGISRSG